MILVEALHDFSVWLKNGFNPADISRFQSHTGNIFKLYSVSYISLAVTKVKF